VGDDGLVEMGGQVALPCFKKFMFVLCVCTRALVLLKVSGIANYVEWALAMRTIRACMYGIVPKFRRGS